MNLQQTLTMMREREEKGLLHNDFDDFIFQNSDNIDAGYRFALSRLRRLARARSLEVDDNMRQAAEKFAAWLEMNRSGR